MDHHRSLRFAFCIDILEIKTLGQVIVDLNRAQLPLSSHDVPDDKVNFRAVKGRLSRLLTKLNTQTASGLTAGLLGTVPFGWISDVFAAIRIAQADPPLGNLPPRPNIIFRLNTPAARPQLILCAKQMCIILGKTTHARHASQFTGLFPSYTVQLSQSRR